LPFTHARPRPSATRGTAVRYDWQREALIKTRRIYEAPKRGEGFRVLVDRVWPRGLSKDKAGADLWLRDIAPSDTLRKWFAHDPKKWTAFVNKYREELKGKKDSLRKIKQLEKEHGTVTLLYSAKDEEHNQAVALCRFLQRTRRP
jgi:uncharacterized protein YeaO (DUF488 family)